MRLYISNYQNLCVKKYLKPLFSRYRICSVVLKEISMDYTDLNRRYLYNLKKIISKTVFLLLLFRCIYSFFWNFLIVDLLKFLKVHKGKQIYKRNYMSKNFLGNKIKEF